MQKPRATLSEARQCRPREVELQNRFTVLAGRASEAVVLPLAGEFSRLNFPSGVGASATPGRIR